MLRAALITAALLLVFPAAASAASVTLTACEPSARAAGFEARMDKIAGAARMKLRFSLEARKVGAPWRRIAAPEFGGWRTADPATTRYISSRRVTALVGPSSYRAVVRFKWVDADGRTVASARLRSKACWQPDHRPNLKLRALSIEAGTHYVALVANTGHTASGVFELSLAGQTLTVPDLAPGEERLVEADGPECAPGERMKAMADPLDLIDERSERDNAFTLRCT